MSEGSVINQMSELVMFRKPTRTQNSKGQYIETFVDFRKALMKVERVSGEEVSEGERVNIPEVFQFSGYNYSEVDETYRVSYDDVEYNILFNPERFNHKLFMRFKAIKVFK